MQGARGSNSQSEQETLQTNPWPKQNSDNSPHQHPKKTINNNIKEGHKGSVALSPCGPCYADRASKDIQISIALLEEHASDSHHLGGALDGRGGSGAAANFVVFVSGCWTMPTGNGRLDLEAEVTSGSWRPRMRFFNTSTKVSNAALFLVSCSTSLFNSAFWAFNASISFFVRPFSNCITLKLGPPLGG